MLLSLPFAASRALACSPPAPGIQDAAEITLVLGAESFLRELNAQVASSGGGIVRVERNETIDVVLSNGCTIRNRIRYLPPPPEFPGLCPQLEGVYSRTVCGKP